VAAIAGPASAQPAKKTGRFGATATISRLMVPSTEPAVITARGPRRSRMRPTRIPARAETTSPSENAAVVAPAGQPVAAVICGLRTGRA
jgi:hypothetical protein